MLKIFLEQAAAEDQYPLPAPRQRRHPARTASASHQSRLVHFEAQDGAAQDGASGGMY